MWIGLTQAQENQFGFDARTWGASRVFFFQFKASSRIVHDGRRFEASHDQLLRLIQLSGGASGTVFYVFPDIGTEAELQHAGGDVLSNTWLLDVTRLPATPTYPTTIRGPVRPRASGNHLVYLRPPIALIRSDPVEVRLERPSQSLFEGDGVPDAGRKLQRLAEQEWSDQRSQLAWRRYERYGGGRWAAAVVIPM